MCGLGILWAVKSSAIALAFPFFVVAMVPLRLLLGYLPEPLKFTPQELEEVSQLNIKSNYFLPKNVGKYCM